MYYVTTNYIYDFHRVRVDGCRKSTHHCKSKKAEGKVTLFQIPQLWWWFQNLIVSADSCYGHDNKPWRKKIMIVITWRWMMHHDVVISEGELWSLHCLSEVGCLFYWRLTGRGKQTGGAWKRQRQAMNQELLIESWKR